MHTPKTLKITGAIFFIIIGLVLSALGLVGVRTSPVSAQTSQVVKCADGEEATIPATASGPIPADEACVNNGGAATICTGANDPDCQEISFGTTEGQYQCGKGDREVKTSFNFGCQGEDYPGTQLNPVMDIIFSLIRFISVGVGVIVIASMIVAGMRYSASQGNPQATAAAIKQITKAVAGLFIYIFAYALIEWIVPGGLFR